MKKIYHLLLFFYLFNPAYSFAQKKYNIIYIPVDDMSIAFDAFGNPFAQCPNIARLAQHGVMFRQCYAQYSLCNPSRTSTFSARRPDSTGVTDNNTDMRSVLGNSFRFLNEYFHDYNYRTESFGKFSCEHEYEISWDSYFVSHLKTPENEVLKTNEDGRQTPTYYIDTSHTLDRIDDGIETTALLRRLQKPVSTPYFYNLGLQTHNPFSPISVYWDKIGDSLHKELLPVNPLDTVFHFLGNGSGNIPISKSPPDDIDDIPAIALKYLIPYPPKEQQRIRHAYYGEMMQMDANLGRVLDAMDQLRLWDSSIVIFYSDHGLQMGEHGGLWLKIALYEETQRVPFIICAPGIKPGVSNELVELIDIFPTLTELCGLPLPPGCEGSSLVPLLENPNAPWKKAIFSQLRRNDGADTLMGRAVRTKTFHYNSWQSQGEELYYLVNDSCEFTNLAVNHPEYTDSLNKLRKLLVKGWKGAKPPVYKRHNFYRDADGDGYGIYTDIKKAYFSPDGYTSLSGDCNDTDSSVHPAAPEKMCNAIDDNCNDKIDENKIVATITVLGNLDICISGYVDLIANDGNGLSYQWKKDRDDIAGATMRTYRATQPGKYKVLITEADTCSYASKGVVVTNIICDKIGNKRKTSADKSTSGALFSVYPNPSMGTLNVNYTSSNAGAIQFTVFDMAGKSLMGIREEAIYGKNVYKLNLSNLKPGAYYLELKSNSPAARIKFIIEQ